MPKRTPKKTLYVRLYDEDEDIIDFIEESDCINEGAFIKGLIRRGINGTKEHKEKKQK